MKTEVRRLGALARIRRLVDLPQPFTYLTPRTGFPDGI